MFTEFGPQELQQYLQTAQEPPLLLDVREPWEYSNCHLPGSQLIPMRQIPTALNELDPDRETVVICHHGIRSRSVAMYLIKNEFSKVINLRGGIDAWAREVDPNMPTY